jgi:AsmA protein
MRKIVRISLWVLGAAFVVLLLLAAALYFLIDAEPYRGPIQARLERALDREVRFGEIRLSLFGTLGLRLDDFEVLGNPGDPQEIILSAKSLRAGARLRPLLQQRLEVTSIVVDRPVLTLHRFADGSWSLPSLSTGEESSGSFSVQELRIKEGTLALRFESSEEALDIYEIDLSLGLGDLDAAIPLEISASIDGIPGELSMRGTIDLSAEKTALDLELLPAHLTALAKLFAIDLPVELSSPEPLEIELALSGPLDELDISGSARIDDLTISHPAMLQPMEQVRGTINFENRTVEIDELYAVIGSSDVAGKIIVAEFDPPHLRIDLKSKHADFWELFSFMAPAEEGPPPPLTVEGNLAIDGGSLATLDFTNLAGSLAYSEGVLTMDPLDLNLYEGSFGGRLVQDMRRTPATLTLQGNIKDISADPFLAANLDLGGIMTGLASGEQAVELRTGEWATIVGSLSGGGPLRVVDGHLAKIDVLRPLSRVAGIFGERTMKGLTRQLSAEGTDFTSLEMNLGFGEGRVVFDDLLLTSPEFDLRGSGSIDMNTAYLESDVVAVMSPEVSALMREEDSRAASVFMDASGERVSIPFKLEGPAAEPEAKVDWKGAAQESLKREATDEIRKFLKKQFGKDEPEEVEPADEEEPTELRGLITRIRRGGSFLLPDLVIEGTVQGLNLDRASIVVLDAGGRELKKVDSISAVTDHLQAAADPAAGTRVNWKVAVDGKRLALASYPIRIDLTVFDTEGNSSTATREVED